MHNLNYWQFGDYLGHRCRRTRQAELPHRVVRQVRWREPASYMDKALAGTAISNDEVARRALPFEFMLNALRLREGFELARFVERTGCRCRRSPRRWPRRRRGLIEQAGGWLCDAARLRLLSDLQSLFLAD